MGEYCPGLSQGRLGTLGKELEAGGEKVGGKASPQLQNNNGKGAGRKLPLAAP
jgi:hypothetical protein